MVSAASACESPVVPPWSARELDELALRQLAELGAIAEPHLRATLRALLQSLGTMLELDRSALFVITPDRRGFSPVASWHREGVLPRPERGFRAPGSALAERALRGQTTIVERVDDTTLLSAVDQGGLEPLQQRSLLLVPIRVGGGTVGAHALGSVRRYVSWPPELVEALQGIEHVVGGALARLLFHEQVGRERAEHEQTQRTAGLGHWRYDFATRAMRGSTELLRMLRLDPRADLAPQDLLARVHPDDRARFDERVGALLDGTALDPIECRLCLGGDRPRWVRCWGELQCDPQGVPVVAHGVLHDITERKEAQRVLASTNRRLVRAQEDERARLGRELHDDLGQRVTALVLRLESLRESAGVGAPALVDPLADTVEQLSELGLIVRDLSHSLHPADLRRVGLRMSLASLCRRCSMIGDIDVELDDGDDDGDGDGATWVGVLPDAVELALFRVAQESVSNALRHAGARRVVVAATSRGDRTQVSVRDDGRGFDAEALVYEGGLGLLGMHERMRQAGGTLEIVSRPGLGTTVVATVPTAEGAAAG